ncbi:F-box protein At3g07870-like [Chenopodium quinoa]|uniref:F-box protein At3g07870-like n=1 Tax=Chenopodium quinoa TaxID=63459 RepID=UPI000B789801|nr:F-box protein At3g07870-like [Chenopodium quinoa]
MLESSSSSNSGVAKVSDLPGSILINIFGRLPLKTVINCKFVCKSWRSLISDSYFYQVYSHHIPTTVFFEVKEMSSSLLNLKEISVIDRQSCGIAKMQLTTNSRDHVVDIRNMNIQLGNGCNGLICLRGVKTGEPSLIWNPITRQVIVVPKPATTADDNNVVAGFGLCGHTNRYKVLRIFHKKRDPPSRWRVEIYDLGTGNKWREIGDAPFPIPSTIPGFFINNTLHWNLDKNNKRNDHVNANNNNSLICGFDFIEENFKAIKAPPIFSSHKKNKYHWSNLGIIGNFLSICAIDAKAFRPDIQVWVMEKYGVPESWALRFSIRDFFIDWCNPYRSIQVINIRDNDEILMLCANHFVKLYNLRERRFRTVEIFDFPVIAHVPSFVSLKDVFREHPWGSG